MFFLKKTWPFIVVGLVVACVWTAMYLRSDKSSAPVKVYEVPQQTLQGQSNTESAIRQDTQRVETSERQVPETDESSVESETYLTGDFLGTVVAETTEESKEVESDALDMETSSATPQLSAEESRRKKLLQRKAEIYEQLKTMAPEGVTIHAADDREGVLRALKLFKELNQIDGELSGRSNDELFRSIQRSIYLTKSLTPDGELPVIAAAEMADSWEQEGNFEAASRMRQVVQNAVESGDEVIKREHVEDLQ